MPTLDELKHLMQGSGRARTQLMDLRAAVRNTPPPIDFVLPGLPARTVGALVAPGGSGKTYFALQAALAVAGGADTLGLFGDGNRKIGDVVYFSGEDLDEFLWRRISALGDHLSEAAWENVFEHLRVHTLTDETPDLLDAGAGWPAWLRDEAEGSRLVVLDTLRRFHVSDENDNAAAARLLAVLERVSRTTGTAILFVHHTSKAAALGGNGDAQQASRGSSVLTDNARCQINLVGMARDEANPIGLDEESRRRMVRAVWAKANYAPPLADRWFRRTDGGLLQPVDLSGNTAGTQRGGKRRARAEY